MQEDGRVLSVQEIQELADIPVLCVLIFVPGGRGHQCHLAQIVFDQQVQHAEVILRVFAPAGAEARISRLLKLTDGKVSHRLPFLFNLLMQVHQVEPELVAGGPERGYPSPLVGRAADIVVIPDEAPCFRGTGRLDRVVGSNVLEVAAPVKVVRHRADREHVLLERNVDDALGIVVLTAQASGDTPDVHQLQLGTAVFEIPHAAERHFIDIHTGSTGSQLRVRRCSANGDGGATGEILLEVHAGNGPQIIVHADQLFPVDERAGNHGRAHRRI